MNVLASMICGNRRLNGQNRRCWGLWICLLVPLSVVYGQTADSELLRQQQRERALREQLENAPQTRLPRSTHALSDRLPDNESPCFLITQIQLVGEQASRFLWALAAVDPKNDPATGRCLGTTGINTVMTRITKCDDRTRVYYHSCFGCTPKFNQRRSRINTYTNKPGRKSIFMGRLTTPNQKPTCCTR